MTRARGFGESEVSDSTTFYLNPFLTHVTKHKQQKLKGQPLKARLNIYVQQRKTVFTFHH